MGLHISPCQHCVNIFVTSLIACCNKTPTEPRRGLLQSVNTGKADNKTMLQCDQSMMGAERMLPNYLIKKIPGKELTVKDIPHNDYRIITGMDDGTNILYTSCPLYQNQTTLSDDAFFKSSKVIYRGINAKLFQERNSLILEGNIRLSFTFAELQNCGHFCSFFGEDYTDTLGCTQGTIFPTMNGFAIEGEQKVGLTFSSEQFVNLCNMGDYCLLFDEKDQYIFSIHCYMEDWQTRPVFFTESDGYRHTVKVKNAGGKIILTINAYVNKSLFDTTLDKYYSVRNNVYAEAAYLGDADCGGQWLILRPDCKLLQDLYKKDVKKAAITFYNLNRGKGKLQYGYLNFLWCAFTAVWETREEPCAWKEIECRGEQYLTIDVTDYIDLLFQNRILSSPGIVIKSDSSSLIALPTADSYLFPIVLEIVLKE